MPNKGEPGKAGIGGQGGAGGRGGEGVQGPIGRPGAEGARGAEGRAGAEGRVGAAGETGDRGEVGFTGPSGLRGTDGMDGLQGRPGETGHDGSAGPVGMRGNDAPPVLSRLQTFALFLFVVACFVALAWRTQINIDDTREGARVACERVNENGVAINSFLDILISATQKSTSLPEAEKPARIAAYEATKVDPIRCT
jgi:hypothetical protein